MYICASSLRVLIAAWLVASHISCDGVWLNRWTLRYTKTYLYLFYCILDIKHLDVFYFILDRRNLTANRLTHIRWWWNKDGVGQLYDPSTDTPTRWGRTMMSPRKHPVRYITDRKSTSVRRGTSGPGTRKHGRSQVVSSSSARRLRYRFLFNYVPY